MDLFSVGGIIQIIFVIGKVFGFLNWSWWIVLIPLWISLIASLLDIWLN